MAFRSLWSKPSLVRSVFHSLLSPNPRDLCSNPSLPNLVNELSRVLSDHRNPQDELELSLSSFAAEISTTLVEQVLKRCKKLSFPAQRFFLWAKGIPGFKHSPESYHILVDSLGQSKQFAMLWDLLIDARDSDCFEFSSEIFYLVFRAYTRANLPRDAIRAFGRMSEFGVKPSVDDLDQLLFTLCKRRHVKYAHEFFDQVKAGFEPKAKTFSILIRGWGDIGDSEPARKLFDEMRERECSLDVPAYHSYLEALCKGGNAGEAYEVFRALMAKGLIPDAGTYSIFIRAYCKAEDVRSVFSMLDRMKRYGLFPNVYTCNCIIKTLCKDRKVDEAYNLVREMVKNGTSPDSWSYNAILAVHCERFEVNKALKILSRIEKYDAKPDRHTYNMMLKMLIRVGRLDRMSEVWNGMPVNGIYPSVSTYSVMIHGLCKKYGKLEEACNYFETMVDEGIPPYSTTVEMLRGRLFRMGWHKRIEIIARKMDRSTCRSIQAMADMMRGEMVCKPPRTQESDFEIDFESD